MSALPLASARLTKLLIQIANLLLDTALYPLFRVFNHDSSNK